MPRRSSAGTSLPVALGLGPIGPTGPRHHVEETAELDPRRGQDGGALRGAADTEGGARSVRISCVTPPRSLRHQLSRSKLVGRVRSTAKRTAGAWLQPMMATSCARTLALFVEKGSHMRMAWSASEIV